MAQDTQYAAGNVRFASKGLVARNVTDTVPEHAYLNMANAEEREENALSIRYGSQIITRDPNDTNNGQNYFLPNEINTLSRLKYNANTWRYAGDTSGILYRRMGDTQGPYTSIYSQLSGERFSSVVSTCFESAQPYLFISDADAMIKDAGTGTPTHWGILGPNLTANVTEYAPQVLLIDGFTDDPSLYGLLNVANFGGTLIGVTTTTTTVPVNNFLLFGGTVTGIQNPFNGCLAVAGSGGTVIPPPPPPQLDIVQIVTSGAAQPGPGAAAIFDIQASTTFANSLVVAGETVVITGTSNPKFNGTWIVQSAAGRFRSIICIVPPPTATDPGIAIGDSSTGGVVQILGQGGGGTYIPGKGVQALLFNIFSTPNPSQFSGVGVTGALKSTPTTFTMSGYAGVVEANTTGEVGRTVALDLSQNYQVTDDDLIAICLQLSDPSAVVQVNLMFDINNSNYTSSYYTKSISPAYYQAGIDGTQDAYDTAADQILANSLGLLTGSATASDASGIVAQLQSSTANTGPTAWSTIWSRRGDFLAVGNAGNPGFDWSSVTGWQVQIQTTTDSSVVFGINGIYLQWGAGPSSFGGTGYDYRYIYRDAQTGTPSNPSPIQYFSQQFGYVPSYTAPIVLRQAFNVSGQYSSDPQVTHVEMYRRGGSMNQNWYYVDRIPNVTGTGMFSYKDVIPDAALAESDILQLDNDPPVTSSLQNPIITMLATGSSSPGTTPYSLFAPQTIVVAQSTAVFVPGQIVDIGTPQNLEQVYVVTGGTGRFTGIMRLQHNAGEPVYVYSVPAQPCDLCEVAYNKIWLAGDPNNPNFLYYSKPGYPENFGPQNYIIVGTPSSPITAIVNFRGTLFVATLTTWYQIVDGNPPYAQTTGSRHGLVSKHGYTLTEGAIAYEAIDGIREFRGADGAYMTLPVEWLYQDVDSTPVPLVDRAKLSDVVMAYQNNLIFAVYAGLDGENHRLIFNTSYGNRIRNDNVNATAMFYEPDTNFLLYAKLMPQGGYAIVQDRIGDYDDGGWITDVLVKTPIDLDIQQPFQDVGAPHNPKQWNEFELDVYTAGQDLEVSLLFDENPTPLVIGTVNTTSRLKVQLPVNAGLGQQAYRCSPSYAGSFTSAPQIYQVDIHAAKLAEYRNSFDTYWIKFGTDESKLVKEGYFDYTSTEDIIVNLYADDLMTPYYTFTLPANANRAVVRVRFTAQLLRRFRVVANSTGDFQFWTSPSVSWKMAQAGHSYQRGELTV